MMKIRVYYEDTDLGGIVYHTNYIKYCERARSEVFFSRGMLPHRGDNTGFVVKDMKASFLSTSTLGDLLSVKSNVIKLKKSSLILKQEIWKEENKIFSMEIVLVYLKEGKPFRIPEEFRVLFDNLLS